MNILVLNDMKLEIGRPPSYYTDAYDYTQANFTQVLYKDQFIAALNSQYWDEVWLDHDLGLLDWNGKKATYAIQEMVAAGQTIQVGRFIVTSYNPYSAKSMLSDLMSYDLNAVAIVTDQIPGVKTAYELFVPEGGFRAAP